MSNQTTGDKEGSGQAAKMKEAIQAIVTAAVQPMNEQLQTLNEIGIEQLIRQLNERAIKIEMHSEEAKELISKELGGLTKRLDDVDQRYGEVGQHLRHLDSHLDHIDERLNDVDKQILNSVEASYQAYNVGCGSGLSRPFKPIPVRIRTSSTCNPQVDIDNNSDIASDSGRTLVVSPVDRGLPPLVNVASIDQLAPDQLHEYLSLYNINHDESLSHEAKVDNLKVHIGCSSGSAPKDQSGVMIMLVCTVFMLGITFLAQWYHYL